MNVLFWICLSNLANPPRGRATKLKPRPPAAEGSNGPVNPTLLGSLGVCGVTKAMKIALTTFPEPCGFTPQWRRAGRSSSLVGAQVSPG